MTRTTLVRRECVVSTRLTQCNVGTRHEESSGARFPGPGAMRRRGVNTPDTLRGRVLARGSKREWTATPQVCLNP